MRALFVYGQVYVARCLLEQALMAQKNLAGADSVDTVYYQGKISAARYYAKNVLPNVVLTDGNHQKRKPDGPDLPGGGVGHSVRMSRDIL